MSIAGHHFWGFYMPLTLNITSLEEFHPHLLGFYFRVSFGSCGPCIHCTTSHRQFVRRNEIDIDRNVFEPFWTNRNQYNNNSYNNSNSNPHYQSSSQIISLPQALYRNQSQIKNCVNIKLNKTIPDLDIMEFAIMRQNGDAKNEWQRYFWNWLYEQAMVFPLDVSVKARRSNEHLANQYQDYITLIYQLKNILPTNAPLTQRWIAAFFRHPPTSNTFSDRDQLFAWIYEMHHLCSDHPLNHSLSEMAQLFEQLRSANCSVSKTSCG